MKNLICTLLVIVYLQVTTGMAQETQQPPVSNDPQQPIAVSPQMVIDDLFRLSRSFDLLNKRLSKAEEINDELQIKLTKLQHELELQTLRTSNGFEISELKRENGDKLTLQEAKIMVLSAQLEVQKQLIELQKQQTEIAAQKPKAKSKQKPNRITAKNDEAEQEAKELPSTTQIVSEDWVVAQVEAMNRYNAISHEAREIYYANSYDRIGIPLSVNANWTKSFMDQENAYQKWIAFVPGFLKKPGVTEILRKRNLEIPELSAPFKASQAQWQPLNSAPSRVANTVDGFPPGTIFISSRVIRVEIIQNPVRSAPVYHQ